MVSELIWLDSGLRSWHLLHALRKPKFKLLQLGQNQSPFLVLDLANTSDVISFKLFDDWSFFFVINSLIFFGFFGKPQRLHLFLAINICYEYLIYTYFHN